MEIMKLIRSEGLMLLKLERDSEINIKELM
jgi:hypothetical protein